jgi:hypothetical protein
MRDVLLFFGSLAGAAVLTALAVLVRPENPAWKIILWGGIGVFVACACVLAFDYSRPGQSPGLLLGAGIGIAVFVGFGIALIAAPLSNPDTDIREISRDELIARANVLIAKMRTMQSDLDAKFADARKNPKAYGMADALQAANEKFSKEVRPEARRVFIEVLRRQSIYPPYPRDLEWKMMTTFGNSLVGPTPLSDAADLLDDYVHRLPAP